MNSLYLLLHSMAIRNFLHFSTYAFQNIPYVIQSRAICSSGVERRSEKWVLRAENVTVVPSSWSESQQPDNRAMLFLKKIGKVGGSANRDFRLAIGFDEGPGGKAVEDGMKVNIVTYNIDFSYYPIRMIYVYIFENNLPLNEILPAIF
jgi:hypothetical protein